METNFKIDMELPLLDGLIDRRILINYRVDPAATDALLPPGIEPLIINGYASAGICLLRLRDVGIKNTPSLCRITSENAAHRFLVKWRMHGHERHGVYIPRRDTDSRLNVALAGRLFSWPHYLASFEVSEHAGHYEVNVRGEAQLHVRAQVTTSFPGDSMFQSLAHASSCFCDCSFGLSPSRKRRGLKLIELKTASWDVKPLCVQVLRSSFFSNESFFPAGSIAFDNALLMEGIRHEWRSVRWGS